MNTDDAVTTALSDMADRWDTPTLDPGIIRTRAHQQQHRRRGIWAAAVCVSAVAVASFVVSVVPHRDNGQRMVRAASVAAAVSTPAALGPIAAAPAVLPGVEIRPEGVSSPVAENTVLARSSRTTAVTLRANLTFHGVPARVHSAALLILEPGSPIGVGPQLESIYRGHIVAHGTAIAANPPRPRILTVTSPAGLHPGRYPVVYVFDATFLHPAATNSQDSTGISGQLGVLVITRS